MPVEALAERGPKTLCFGPLKPVGFTDPRTGRRPWALLQLRMESLNGEACNLVGCQTKLTYPEQARVFRLIPGLEHAEAKYLSPYGEVKSTWRRTNSKLAFEIVIPANCEAEIRLPDGRKETVTTGRYTF